MITRIKGRVVHVGENTLLLEVGDFEYELFIPEFNRRQLQNQIGQEASLFTIDYLEGNPTGGRLIPRLIGFLSEAEREFFELFCSVDGVGVKKALRAMVRPVREIANAIEDQDAKTLSTLPGIGPATSERVVATLRRKVPKFALMVAQKESAGDVQLDVTRDAYAALRQVGHSDSDARRLIDAVLATKKKFKAVEDILAAVWESQRTG